MVLVKCDCLLTPPAAFPKLSPPGLTQWLGCVLCPHAPEGYDTHPSLTAPAAAPHAGRGIYILPPFQTSAVLPTPGHRGRCHGAWLWLHIVPLGEL